MRRSSAMFRKVAIPSAALGLGLAVGAGAYAAAGLEFPKFEQNSNGQTIGQIQVGAEAPDLVEIDVDQEAVHLIQGVRVDGLSVYMYASDFEGPVAKSPEEAAKIVSGRVDAQGDIWIPLYLIDGKTVIGKLKVGHVTPTDKSTS